MKSWNEYFNKEEQELNEDHKETRDEKIAWVCKTVGTLPNILVTKVYDFLEDLLEQEEEQK